MKFNYLFILAVMASMLAFAPAYAQISFTSPLPNAEWQQGSAQTITWTADSTAPEMISLHFIYDGGGIVFDNAFLDTFANAGLATYKVAATAEPADNYYLQATTADLDEMPLGEVKPIKVVAATSGINEKDNSILSSVLYPNPSSGVCNVAFRLGSATPVKITITGLDGREIRTISNGMMMAGNYTMSFNTAEFSTGIYLCRITTPEGSTVKRVSVIK
jgi:hypothetical protein